MDQILNKIKYWSEIKRYIIIALYVMLIVSCSTTRRLSVEDPLYTGVRRVKIVTDEKIPSEVKAQVKTIVDVAPNNSLISPVLRYPFPLGLWVYNNWNSQSSGIKHWLYEKLVEEPVLLSDVRPDLRVRMIDEIMENNGYFNSNVKYELIKKRNPKKIKIAYEVNSGLAYRIDTVQLLPDTSLLCHVIDSVAIKSGMLAKGVRYCTDSLSELRTKIANQVRNNGFYYFSVGL